MTAQTYQNSADTFAQSSHVPLKQTKQRKDNNISIQSPYILRQQSL